MAKSKSFKGDKLNSPDAIFGKMQDLSQKVIKPEILKVEEEDFAPLVPYLNLRKRPKSGKSVASVGNLQNFDKELLRRSSSAGKGMVKITVGRMK